MPATLGFASSSAETVGGGMTPEEHQAKHVQLHRALDELLACYVTENRDLSARPPTHRRGSVHNQIVDLLQWAYEKTMLPSPVPEESHDARGPEDFESERQLILLALAELALSRPGFESALREIARRYDGEGLPMFEGFKKSSADRVHAERMPL
jgi:hypothetical protein